MKKLKATGKDNSGENPTTEIYKQQADALLKVRRSVFEKAAGMKPLDQLFEHLIKGDNLFSSFDDVLHTDFPTLIWTVNYVFDEYIEKAGKGAAPGIEHAKEDAIKIILIIASHREFISQLSAEYKLKVNELDAVLNEEPDAA